MVNSKIKFERGNMLHGEDLRKQLLEDVIKMGLLKEAKCLECGRDCEDGIENCPSCGERLGSMKKDDSKRHMGEKEKQRTKHEEITKKFAREKKASGYQDEPIRAKKRASSLNLA